MASTITISSDTFYENINAPGVVDFTRNITISISGSGTFNASNAASNLYATNVPLGWTLAASVGSDGTKEILVSFSGTANDHDAVDSISNLGLYLPLTGSNGPTYINQDDLTDWEKTDFNVVFYGGVEPDPDPDPPVEIIEDFVSKFKTYVLDLQCKHASLGEKISKGYHYGKFCENRNKDFIQLSYIIDILSRHNSRLEELNKELDSTFDHYCLNDTELLKLVDYAYYTIKKY